MKNIKRFSAFLLVFLALAWIGFSIPYLLNTQQNKFFPPSLFSAKGELVTIINKASECNMEALIPQISSVVHSDIPEMIKFADELKCKIYFSSFRDFVVMEKSGIWNFKDVLRLAFLLGKPVLSLEKSSWQLGSDFTCKIDRNFLLLSKSSHDVIGKSDRLMWNFVDKNASYCLVSPVANRVENVYNNRSERYITQNSILKPLPLINDFDLYANCIPAEITTYLFFQKDVAKLKFPEKSNASFLQLVENGFCLFEFENENAIILDDKVGFDALLMFENESQDSKNEIIKFKTIPFNISNVGFSPKEMYALKLVGNTVFTQSKKSAEKILASYKLGNTFTLQNSKLKDGFLQLPKMVSQRSIKSSGFESKAYLKGQVHSTTLRLVQPEIETDLVQERGEVIATLDGDIAVFYAFQQVSGLPKLLIKENSGKFRFVNLESNKQASSQQLVEQNKPQRLVLDGKDFWCLHADLSFSIYDLGGGLRKGYPMSLPKTSTSNVLVTKEGNTVFYWIGTADGALEKYMVNWKLVKSYKLGDEPIVGIYSEKGKLLINMNNKEWVHTTLKQPLKNRKRFQTVISKIRESETSANCGLFYTNSDGLFFIQPDSEPKRVMSGGNFVIHEISGLLDVKIVTISNGNECRIIDQSGRVLGSFQTDLKTIEYASTCVFKGERIVAVVDGIQNNVILYNAKGTQLKEYNWEGGRFAKLIPSGNKLNLFTFVGRYLIKYPINNPL